MAKSSSVLLKRTITVFVFLCFCTLVLWLSHYRIGSLLFLAGANLFVVAGTVEYHHLCRGKGSVSVGYGVLCGVVYCALVFFTSANPLVSLPPPLASNAIPLACMILVFAFFGWRAVKGNAASALFDFGCLVGGVVFVAWLFSFTVRINYFFPGSRGGSWWVISLILIAGGADTFAMFLGKAFGKRKFFSRISPNKTVEGFLGGTLSGIGIGILCWLLFPLEVTFLQGVALAAALSLVSHLGDLAESILKRDAAAKDSGRLPGVGGVLDLMDSGLFAAPVMYFLMKLWFSP